MSYCRIVFVAAGPFSVDLVSVAARDSRGVRNWFWSLASEECNGGRECIAAVNSSFKTTHESPGACFLAGRRFRSLWGVSADRE